MSGLTESGARLGIGIINRIQVLVIVMVQNSVGNCYFKKRDLVRK